MITQKFDLNLIPKQEPVVVHVDQYDTGTGRFIISLYYNDAPYSPSGTATIQGTKPDGRGFSYSATLSGNVVTADLAEQMSIVAGDVRMQVVVVETTGRTGTFAFIMRVQDSALPNDTDMSESDYELIQKGIKAAQVSVEKAAEASGYADDAEASKDAAAQSEANALESYNGAEAAKQVAIQQAALATEKATAAEESRRQAGLAEQGAGDCASQAEASAQESTASARSAQAAELASKDYSDLSKSYAVGTDGEVRQGDATDNSEYYSRMSKAHSDTASRILDDFRNEVDDAIDEIRDAMYLNSPNFVVDFETGHLMYEGGHFDFVIYPNGHLMWGLAV